MRRIFVACFVLSAFWSFPRKTFSYFDTPEFTKRIEFSKGEFSKIISENIHPRSQSQIYLFNATKGQSIEISVSKGHALLQIFKPYDEKELEQLGEMTFLLEDAGLVVHWKGIAPISGDYRIKVLGNGTPGVYKLKVSVR